MIYQKIRYAVVFALALVVSLSGVLSAFPTQSASAASWSAGRIIDDAKFTNASAMSAGDVQSFLNSKNSVCLRNYQTPEPLGNNNYGANVSAATAIWKVGQLYNINPQVLIVTLQKEQGFVTRSDCPTWRYNAAMGFGCPDGAPCDAQWYGLSKQLYQGARHLRGFYDQNAGWYIPYRPGTRYIQWHPNSGCGGTNVNIENRATASLYSYTPYQPNTAALNAGFGTGDGCSSYGNRNFWLYFTAWFGSTLGPVDLKCTGGSTNNLSGVPTSPKVVPNQYSASGNINVSLALPNNTGSGCIEIHTWGTNQQSWLSNVATNHPAVDPADGEIISGNLYGDAKSEIIFVKYRNTGSGRVEIHTWDSTYQSWSSNVATNHPAVDPADGRVIAADLYGDSRDELIFVKYRNTGSGRVEIHTWGTNQQSWLSNVATNHPAVDPADGEIISGNLYGDAKSEIIFVKYRNTGSGRVEIHTWGTNQQSWLSNVATNHEAL